MVLELDCYCRLRIGPLYSFPSCHASAQDLNSSIVQLAWVICAIEASYLVLIFVCFSKDDQIWLILLDNSSYCFILVPIPSIRVQYQHFEVIFILLVRNYF